MHESGLIDGQENVLGCQTVIYGNGNTSLAYLLKIKHDLLVNGAVGVGVNLYGLPEASRVDMSKCPTA